MNFRLLGILAALSTVSLAYRLPDHLEDGAIYAVHKDEHGNATQFNLISRSTDNKRRWSPRGTSEPGLPSDASVGCGASILNAIDHDTAIAALLAGCDSHDPIHAGEDIVAHSGDATAFMCNYGDFNACHSNEAKAAFAALSKRCQYTAGERDLEF